MQLVAAVKACALPTPNVQMELKMCVEPITKLLVRLGTYITNAESIMNQFGIYGGCYRLAWAQYDVLHNRFQVIVGPHRTLITPVFVSAGAKCKCINIPLDTKQVQI